eukprot:3071246-Rhodomonas_salina.1
MEIRVTVTVAETHGVAGRHSSTVYSLAVVGLGAELNCPHRAPAHGPSQTRSPPPQASGKTQAQRSPCLTQWQLCQ